MEKEWLKFKSHQESEYRLQKKITKYKRFIDIDPRPLIRPFNQKKFLKGILMWFKFIAYETLYSIYILFKGNRCKIVKPIFLIGLPHSGTTICMKLVAMHPDITNASELNTLWHTREYLNVNNYDHVKVASDCNEKVKNRLIKRLSFAKFVRGNKRRFMNKNPNNTVTVEFLKECFPDAYIVHIIRDGRSVVNSLLNSMPEVETYDRYKKPSERVSIFPGVKPPDWRELVDENPVLQHAKQWQACVKYVQERKRKLAPNYFELTYEDLCDDPRKVVSEIWKFADLSVSDENTSRLPEKLISKNYKYKKFMSEKDIIELTSFLRDDLIKLDYQI